MSSTRFARQEVLFGREGQQKIEKTTVAIVGVGGNGSHVVQQLSLLGTRQFVLIEPQELDETNKNRYVGHRHDDPIPGTSKLDIADRLIRAVTPDANIVKIQRPIDSEEARQAIKHAHVVFGCLDDEGPRFVLNEICAILDKPLFDLATEVFPGDPTTGDPIRYGGRVFVAWDRPGCLVCCDVLDMEDVQIQLASPEERANRKAVYGLSPDIDGGSGPSVVTLNGVVASIATTEFMVAVTGLRKPIRLTNYRAERGKFTVAEAPAKNGCFTCALVGSHSPA